MKKTRDTAKRDPQKQPKGFPYMSGTDTGDTPGGSEVTIFPLGTDMVLQPINT
jgi:hypothetical protein